MPINKIFKITRKIRNRHFIAFDLIILLLSPYIALLIRTDGNISNLITFENLLFITLSLTALKFVIFYQFGFYNRYWQSASIDELARIVAACITVILFEIFAFYLFNYFVIDVVKGMPYSLPILDSLISIIIIASARFSLRLVESSKNRIDRSVPQIHTIIIGAGDAGVQTQNKILYHKDYGKVVAFVDDDEAKIGLKIKGIPILGPISNLSEISTKLKTQKIIIALPMVSGKKIREIHSICSELDVEVLTLPPIDKILDKDIKINLLRRVQVEDLLRRELVEIDFDKVASSIKDKVVLISGAGGSIGSEICRQVCAFKPSQLIITGHGENSIFEIDMELKKHCRINSIITKIVDIKDSEGLSRIFSKYKPQIVFHAAAHKHVPLMENNPIEAVLNNIMGTKNMVDVSVKFNVDKFILISSDKAVNPTNVMGATKRVAEMIVLQAAKNYGRAFSAVRFGNVLGSRGSVIRTFYRQLKDGGPLTITHPDIMRYFMTIPESVQLVLQASVLNSGGEIFVLDMGEPVKIVDLAKDMIRLSGLRLNEDIDIEITGLRPGEKLFEELFLEGEQYKKTEHEKIFEAVNASNFTHPQLNELIENLIFHSNEEGNDIRLILRQLVPEYVSNNTNLKLVKPA